MPKILLIEDSLTQARRFSLMLEQGGFATERTERLDEGLARVAEGGIDVVLLDLTLPDSSGLETFLTARTEVRTVPIVVLTSLDDEQVAAIALQRGAQDYLVKDEVTQNWLIRAVKHAIARGQLLATGEQVSESQPRAPAPVISTRVDGDVTIVRVTAKRLLDAEIISILEDRLLAMVEAGCRRMVLSFAQVDYISNGAICVLVVLLRKMHAAGGSLRLCDLSDNVQEHLTARQFHKLFEIYDTLEAALEA